MIRLHPRRWTAPAAGILVGIGLVGWTATASPDPAGTMTGASLGPLLERLSQRARLYEKAALGFSCEETVREGKFGRKSGENEKEVRSRYDYLYEGSPESGYREIRMRVEKDGKEVGRKEVQPDLDVPGAYDWALLFSPRHRPHFRFEATGQELIGFHVTVVLRFWGAAPFARGREIEEWSGKVWVDRETLNFVKVEATPNDQEELLPLRTSAWQRSIRLGGVPLRKQPRGYRYQLSFSVEKFTLAFPGDAETRVFVVNLQGEEEIRERIAQRFRNYVFFNVHSAEEFLGTENRPGRRPPGAGPGVFRPRDE